jgi:hypothetical protein
VTDNSGRLFEGTHRHIAMSVDKSNENWQECTPLEQLMADGVNPLNTPIITGMSPYESILLKYLSSVATFCQLLTRLSCYSLPHLIGTALFGFGPEQTGVNIHWVKNVFAHRLTTHPRFRATIQYTKVLSRAYFVPLPGDASLDDHVIEERIPGGSVVSRKAAFDKRIDAILSEDLPMDRPLWRLHYFSNWYSDSSNNTGATLVLRVHHVIGDGVALVYYCGLAISDEIPERPVPRRQRTNTCASDMIRNLSKFGRFCADAAFVLAGTAMPDPRNALNAGVMSGKKTMYHVPHCNALRVDVLKTSSKRLGCTINDIFSAALTGALRRYLASHDSAYDPRIRLHSAMAFNNHVLSGTGSVSLNNKVVLAAMRQHIDLVTPAARLRKSVEQNSGLKTSSIPALTTFAFGVLTAMPSSKLRGLLWNRLLPHPCRFTSNRLHVHLYIGFLTDVQFLICHSPYREDFTRRISITSTNIRGPTKDKIYVDGQRVDSIVVAAPLDGEGGTIVTIFSYENRVSLCVSGDKAKICHADKLGDAMAAELESLCSLNSINL